MSYDATALAAAIKTNVLADVPGAVDTGGYLENFAKAVADAVVAHLNSHPVVIPTGEVLIPSLVSPFFTPNPAPLGTAVS